MANALIKSLIIDDYATQVKTSTAASLDRHEHRHDNDGRPETAVPKPDAKTNATIEASNTVIDNADIADNTNSAYNTDASVPEPVAASAVRRAKVTINTPMIDDNPAFVYKIVDIDNHDILTRTTVTLADDNHISAETDQVITHTYASEEFSVHEITIDDSIPAHPLFKPWINLLTHKLEYNVPLDDRYDLIDKAMDQFLHFIGNLHQKTEWHMEQVVTFVDAYPNIYNMMVMAYSDINDDPYCALQYLDDNIYAMLCICEAVKHVINTFWPDTVSQPDFDTLMAQAYHADDSANHEPSQDNICDKMVTIAFIIACLYAYEGRWRDTYHVQTTYRHVMSDLDPDNHEQSMDWYTATTLVYDRIHKTIVDAGLTFDPAKHGAWLSRMIAHDNMLIYTAQLDWAQYMMSSWMNAVLNHMSVDNLDLDRVFNNRVSIDIDDRLHDAVSNQLHDLNLTPRYIDDDLNALSHASGITMNRMKLLVGYTYDDDGNETIGAQLNVDINRLCFNAVIIQAKTQLDPRDTINTLKFEF